MCFFLNKIWMLLKIIHHNILTISFVNIAVLVYVAHTSSFKLYHLTFYNCTRRIRPFKWNHSDCILLYLPRLSSFSIFHGHTYGFGIYFIGYIFKKLIYLPRRVIGIMFILNLFSSLARCHDWMVFGLVCICIWYLVSDANDDYIYVPFDKTATFIWSAWMQN